MQKTNIYIHHPLWRITIFQNWQDEFLTWNPEDFGGVKLIRLPMNMIYEPDIYVDKT